MNVSSEQTSWRVVGNPVFIAGFAYGCHYPSLILNITGLPLSVEKRRQLSALLREWAPLDNPAENYLPEIAIEDSWHASIVWFLAAVQHLQCASRLGVYERGRILAVSAGHATCIIPISGRVAKLMRAIVDALLDVVGQHSANTGPLDPPERLVLALRSLGEYRPGKSNVPRFVRAAFDLGLPFQELPGDIVQYGIGKRGRWMDSSFTDETPRMAAIIARDKPVAAQMLRRAGLPVPFHHLVATAEAAAEAASMLGYPVVVKPADLDGGVGVAADLESAEEVRASFLKASRLSNRVLVEKHVPGRDYRIVVFQDEVIAAIERVPGGVFGDGRHSVQELIDLQNTDPRRGDGPHALLKLLQLDEKAMALLERAGLNLASVPKNGEFVRMRRAANVASGGMPVSVLDQVHVDNRRLAVRAAKALRLDFAGVDLLITDIARSWRETGAGICEVNAQPNLGHITTAHLYGPILRKLVSGNGRIPTVVVLGADSQNEIARGIASALGDSGFVVGCHDANGVRIGDETIMLHGISTFAAGHALVAERQLGAMVVSVNDIGTLGTGLPFARYDVLVLAGRNIVGLDAVDKQQQQQLVLELFASIMPACDGRVVMVEGSGVKVQGLQHVTRARWDETPIAPDKLVSEVLSALMTCETKHGDIEHRKLRPSR